MSSSLRSPNAEAPDTYKKPERGWTCFHCGETFTTVGGARDHFGAKPDAKPGCLIRVQYGNERGLEMEVRRLEAALADALARLQAVGERSDLPTIPASTETT